MSLRIASSLLTASLLASIALPALAEDATSDAIDGADVRTRIRIDRCDRFTNEDDYRRCVRLIRRLPGDESAGDSGDESASTDPEIDREGFDWKWENMLNQLERKLAAPITFAGTMAKRFCRDRTISIEVTMQDCMTRLGDSLKTRVDALIDRAFRSTQREF